MQSTRTLIVVTGGRNYSNFSTVAEAMARLRGGCCLEDVTVLSGGATGLDTLVLEWAYTMEVTAIRMPAKWKTDGMKAGMVRNGEMIEMARTFWRDGWNVMFIAFPGGNGTANMKMRMKNALHTFEDSAEGNGKNWVRFNEVYA